MQHIQRDTQCNADVLHCRSANIAFYLPTSISNNLTSTQNLQVTMPRPQGAPTRATDVQMWQQNTCW